jgi:hypothetical protein
MGLATIFYWLRFKSFFLSPSTTRGATVEVIDPASTRDSDNTCSNSSSIVASRGYRSDRVEKTIPVLQFTAIT